MSLHLVYLSNFRYTNHGINVKTGYMVNGSILDMALDVDDITAAVTSMGNGRLLPFDAAHDKGGSHLVIAGFLVQCRT